MSGRAVEASGDVDVILLDKTGTITYGNRLAASIMPAPGVTEADAVRAALVSSIRDETPEGRSIVELARTRLAALGEPGRHAGRDRLPAGRAPRSPRRSRSGPRPGRAASGRRPARRSSRAPWMRSRDRLGDRCRPRSWPRPTGSPTSAARRSSSRRDGGALGAHRAQGHGQGRPGRAVRRVPQDGHPDRHDHRRQPADGRDDRPRSRRRRLHRRGDAGDEDRASSARSRPTATSSR